MEEVNQDVLKSKVEELCQLHEGDIQSFVHKRHEYDGVILGLIGPVLGNITVFFINHIFHQSPERIPNHNQSGHRNTRIPEVLGQVETRGHIVRPYR